MSLLLPAGAWGGREFPQQPGEKGVPDEFLVKLAPGARVEDLTALLPALASVTRIHGSSPHIRLHLPPGLAMQVSSRLAASSLVDYFEPNRIRGHAALPPNDASYGSEWGLQTIQALQAWSYVPGRYTTAATPLPARAVIAVLDTGTDCTHPDFINTGGASTNTTQGGQLSFALSSAIIPTAITSPACAWQDDYGHGTHVAGTIAAATSNGVGVSGLAYAAAIATYKILDTNGSGTDADIANAMMAAADAGVKVISMSLGGPGYSQTLEDAATYAWQHGVVIVAAAGNSNTNTLFFPAGAMHVIGVAATDSSNLRASFSNFGNGVDIAAPGVNIYSTLPVYTNKMGSVNYGWLSGTSMATPHVSGAAGLIAMAYPGVSPDAIVQRLQQSAASSLAGGGWDQYYGFGIVNAASAVAGVLRTAAAGGIVGQVVDASKLPVRGATVFTTGAPSVTTAGDGFFRLANIVPGKHLVTVTATGFPTTVIPATVPAGADVTLPVQLGASLGQFTGYVTAGGSGVAGAAVDAISGGVVQASTIADVDGSFTLPVLPGTYDIRVSAIGLVAQTDAAHTVSSGGTASVNFVLARLGTIGGAVVDFNGAPLSGVQILVTSGSFSGGASTDSAGQFSTLGLPSGTYTLSASAPGFDSLTLPALVVSADATTTVSLKFGFEVSAVNLGAASVTGGASIANNSVTLTAAAPAGGTTVNLSSSDPSASVPATVIVPAGATSATFTITTAAVAALTSTTITAELNGNSRFATLSVNAATLTSLAISPSSVPAGGIASGTVSLNGPAPAGGAAVTLTSSDPAATVPAGVTVTAGAATATFNITTTNTGAQTSVTISAAYGGVTRPAGLTVYPIVLSSLALSPTALVSGVSSASNTVNLNSPAPAGGAVVSLTSSDPAATVPPSVTVAAGATSANFNIATSNVASPTIVTISAAFGGVTKPATLTVNPVVLSSLALSPAALIGGASSTANTVNLNGPAPSTGAVVALSSSDLSATVPPSVTVLAGATSAKFNITTTGVASPAIVTISAVFGGVTKPATLTVNPVVVSSLSLSPAALVGGASSTANTVNLNGPAPSGGAVVTLTSSDASATVPPSVTVLAGATSAKFNITSTGVASPTIVTISAAYGGVTKPATLTVNPVAVSSLYLSTPLVGGLSSTSNTIYLNGPAPSSGAIVTLSSSSATATVPASVTVAAGATSATFPINSNNVAVATTVTISAAYGGVTKPGALTLNPVALSSLYLSPTALVGGVPSTSNRVYLNGPAPSGGAVVTLTSSDPSAAVPPVVTVPAGATSAIFGITTTNVSAATSVTVSAIYAGLTKPGILTVNPVVASSLSLSTPVVGGLSSASNRIYLNGPAPSSGAVVTLTSSSAAAAVPPTVTVPAGATSAIFSITTTNVSVATNVTISAAYGGVTKPGALILNPVVASSLSLSTPAVGGLSLASNRIYLNGPAPSTGAVVTLTSSSAAAAVPPSVTVAAGATSAIFSIATTNVSVATSVTISASYGGVTKQGTLTLNAVALSSLYLSPIAVVGGVSSSSNTVYLNGPAPSGGAAVTLTSSNPSAAVPPSVSVAAGATSAKFNITTTNVSAATSVTISAAYGGVSKPGTLSVNPVAVASIVLSPSSLTGGTSSTGNTVTLNGPAPSGGVLVALSSSGSAATVPPTVTVPGGATSAKFTITTSTTLGITSTLTISAAYGGVTKPATLTVN